MQAAKDDWSTNTPPFNYAIVGHNLDTGRIDGDAGSVCCQCYELVFANPGKSSSPDGDNEACTSGNAECDAGSAIAIPPPLIVQAFDVGATSQSFDVFMGAGGFGAFDACYPAGGQSDPTNLYMYTNFPAAGAPPGGLKVSTTTACKDNEQHITTATLNSPACQAFIDAGCSQIQAASPTIQDVTVRSCFRANDPNALYHLNWQVYAKRIECPSHLTEVTGCQLAPQGLPTAQPNITAAQASQDSSWLTYWTTQMQDCCMPSCAAVQEVEPNATVGLYNTFYSCDHNGNPNTQ